MFFISRKMRNLPKFLTLPWGRCSFFIFGYMICYELPAPANILAFYWQKEKSPPTLVRVEGLCVTDSRSTLPLQTAIATKAPVGLPGQ